jgi:hypothetical protein
MSPATKAKHRRAGARKRPLGRSKARPASPGGAATDKARSEPLGLDVDAEVLEFIEALDRFKKSHGRPFPSWSEVLHVLRELGYRKG